MGRTFVLLLLTAFIGVDPVSAMLTSATQNPANSLATGRGTWFSGNGVGGVICTGMNTTLACPYGAQPNVGKVAASISLQNKSPATTYTLTVVDLSGPAGISTIISATFASTGTSAATLAAGVSDTIDLVLKVKGNTPIGTYAGFLVVADSTSGMSVAIPLSLTH